MGELTFKTIQASVRPPRVAVLVESSDPDWQSTCLRVIEFYSQQWGGAYNLIVPTDGTKIDERFWTLLESYDPDYILCYQKSLEDVALSQPERYSQILDREVDAYTAQTNSSNSDLMRAEIDKQLRRASASRFTITDNLNQELKARLAPFWFEKWTVNAGPVTAGARPDFHLTDLSKIISATEHPDRVTLVESAAGISTELWYCAVTGRLERNGELALKEAGVKPHRLALGTDGVSQLIDFVAAGDAPPRPLSAFGNAQYTDLETTPYRISMLQLGLYRSTKYQHWREPPLLIIGNTIEDFCLYYCLARLRGKAVWMLPSLTERAFHGGDLSQLARAELDFLFRVRKISLRSSQYEGGLKWLSCSLAPEQAQPALGQFALHGFEDLSVDHAQDLASLVHFPLTVIERDNIQRDISVQFSDFLSVSAFATPKPKHFHPIHPYEHRYITQLSIAGEPPPKHPELGLSTIRDSFLTTLETRVGKEGPAYFCPSIAYFGGDIDTVLVRPRLYLPPLQQTIAALAARVGYDCRPSDKGIYAEESIAKWGGLTEISKFLRDRPRRSLLDLFLDTSPSADGKGVYLQDDRRRYLDFRALTSVLGSETPGIVDDLIQKQILYRGFIFRCAYCRSASWFSIADVTQEFKCRRCGRSQVYTKHHWKAPDEPAWYYKLDELVYQGYRHGMAVSILALENLRAACTNGFMFTTDREFYKTGTPIPEVEADFICSQDGVLTVGEAKTGGTLGEGAVQENEKINKYVTLADRLFVRQLVLATLSESWSERTTQAVRTRFRDRPSVTLLFLDASALLPA